MENEQMAMKTHSYKTFAFTMVVSFLVMYAVMFLNVFDTDDIYISATRFYMALLMVSPMAFIMLIGMKAMYKNKRLNRVIVIFALIVFILSFCGLRHQTFIGDVQYMKAMIPHHSSAILTSTNADIKDPEVRKLADGIIESQKKEMAEMKAILKRMGK